MKQENLSGHTLQQGFTLIEIAIVLVIVGLVLGGALKGQELINSARVRAAEDQLSGISSAWFAFQDRYHAIPGDYAGASRHIDASLKNGNGNGIIDSDAESGQVWAHLGEAGLLSGRFDGKPAAASFNCSALTCPRGAFNRGILIRYGDQSVGPNGEGRGGKSHEIWLGGQIPVRQLAELDRKLDDGKARSGRLQLSRNADGFDASASCLDSGDYNLLASDVRCAGIWRGL